jgi:hypothetical protein
MLSFTSPYGRTWDQNSGVSPSRSSGVSVIYDTGISVFLQPAAVIGEPDGCRERPGAQE